MVDGIFRAQPEMFRTQDWRGTYLRIAQSAGMNEQQFQTCLSDPAALKALNDRVQLGIKDEIDGTPFFIVNGKKLGSGEKTLAELDAAVAAAKKK